jgi:hypothetical protein
MHLREPFPLRTYLGLSLLGLGCGFVGAVSGASAASALAHPAAVSIPEIAVALPDEPVTMSTASTGTDAEPPSTQVGFVTMVAGAHWFVLDVDATTVKHRAAPQLVDDDGIFSAIAPLHARELTPALRAWRGTAVTVDGTCTDTVRDFAVITQLTGDPGYAGEADEARWTAASVAKNGNSVIAVKLEHCTGTYARAVGAPPVVPFFAVDDARSAEATTELMKSDLARQARAEFTAQLGESTEPEASFDRATQITTHAARDPRNGTLWIAVHARAEFACGGPEDNFWALYRATGDQLITVASGMTSNLASIDALVDLDGDGVPEVLGSGWISPTHAFYGTDMTELSSFSVPYFGCPC